MGKPKPKSRSRFNVCPADLVDAPSHERARFKARQGGPTFCAGEIRVVDEEIRDVFADGQTMGEVVMRGNVVMKEYFADPEATE